METVCCDLCGADNTDTIYVDTDLHQDVPPGCALVRCRNCGLMYLNPRPTADEIGTYYPKDYHSFRPAVEDERFWLMRWIRRRKLAQRRQLVEKFSGIKRGRILDVGCSTGLFLHEMVLSGWAGFGVEPGLSAVTYAKQRFGLNVYHGMLAHANFPEQSFDVVSFWDVLEHTFSPAADLRRTAILLKSGGLIAINIPNYNSTEKKWFGPLWNGYDPPRHLYVFTRQTLTALLQKTGFEPVAWTCFMSSYYSFIISLIQWLQKYAPKWAEPAKKVLSIPGVRFFFEPYLTVLNWLGRGSVIAVFAYKK